MNEDKILQSSPVQQLLAAAGNPNRRWSKMTTTPPPSNHQSLHLATVSPPPHSFLPKNEPPPSMYSWHHDHHNQEFQDSSLTQLLLSGILMVDEEDHKLALTQMQKVKKLENWEEQLLHDDDDDHHHLHRQLSANGDSMVVKQEASVLDNYGYGEHNYNEVGGVKPRNWSAQMIQLSSCPNSCVISSRNNADGRSDYHRSSESNSSSGSGGASKKAKVEPPSSTQSTLKVKKEKLGDRITALHQMVSPFGKTDTASVLLEVMGYIKFLEAQIQALSVPYFGVQLANMTHHQHSDCDEEPRLNLKSVGLCLVPVSCTMQVDGDNGADYWAPANNLRL